VRDPLGAVGRPPQRVRGRISAFPAPSPSANSAAIQRVVARPPCCGLAVSAARHAVASYLPWSGRHPPTRILLLGARAPSSAVGGCFSGLPGPNCTIKFLPTLESLTYPGAATSPEISPTGRPYLPWSGRHPPMRILLLGAQAPSRAVGGYFSGFPGPNCTIKFLPTLESFLTYPGVAYLPWSGRHSPMRILLLGAPAPSSAVGGYFSGFPGPNCTIKFLPTLESFLTYPGAAYLPRSKILLYKPSAARQTHYRVRQALFSLVNVLKTPRGHV
jgi:hypothetical protein